MKLLSYLCCFCVVESVVTGIIVLLLNPKAALNRVGALSAFVYSFWAFGMMFAYGSEDPQTRVVFYQFSFWGSLYATPCMIWLYLLLGEVSPTARRWSVGLSAAYSTAVFIDYLVNGFYYGSFRDAPWGDIGVPATNWFWATMTPFLSAAQMAAVMTVLALRAKRSSERFRRQLRVLIPGMAATFVVDLGAWLLEVLYGIPNMMVLSGNVLIVVNLYLIARYRYLIPDRGLLERHLFDTAQESALFLDVHRRITGVNPQALRRFGVPEDRVVGTLFDVWLDDTVLLRQEWTRVSGHRSHHRGQLYLMAGKTVVVTFSPRFDRFNDLTGVVALIGDLPDFDGRAHRSGLTARQKQILLLAMQDIRFAEIADALAISSATVKAHIHNMCEKTGSANRVELFARLLAT